MTTNLKHKSNHRTNGRSPKPDRELPLTGRLSFRRGGFNDDEAEMFNLVADGVYADEE